MSSLQERYLTNRQKEKEEIIEWLNSLGYAEYIDKLISKSFFK